MEIVFTIAGLHRDSGGPSRSVPALCIALARAGAHVELFATDSGRPAAESLVPTVDLVKTTLLSCRTTRQQRTKWSPEFSRALRARCHRGSVQVLHDTGVWLPTNHACAGTAREFKLPRIVSPRGMLSSWALNHNGWKKRMAWWIYQRGDLRSATLLHATAQAEAGEFRNIGLGQPIAVVPNGIDLQTEENLIARERGEASKTLLFIGRIHRKKGLLDLVEAWKRNKPAGWCAVIAGDDDDNHLAELKQTIAVAGLHEAFSFPGQVDGLAKWELYRSADLFVLPSHSENFGIVVAEALACGLPVITTRGTPWEDLVKHRCGWWTDVGAEPLSVALREAMNLSDEARHEMGLRGRQLVEQEYSWSKAAGQMMAVYNWILGKGPQPACVVT